MSTTDSEILSVVDSADRVIGKASRADIHRLGLRHRAVHVLVWNQAGKLFLQQRSESKDTNPGLWDSSAAGHVEAFENYDECAARELREELGIEVQDRLKTLFKLTARAETGMEFCTLYRLDHEGPFHLNPHEIQTGNWFSPAELDRWILLGGSGLTGTFQTIWGAVREDFGSKKNPGAEKAAPDQ